MRRSRSRRRRIGPAAASIALAASSIAHQHAHVMCHAFTHHQAPTSLDAPAPLQLSPQLSSGRRRLFHLHVSSDGSTPPASASSVGTPSTISATLPNAHDRATAQEMVDLTLCPSNEERDRSTAGMEAYGGGRGAISNDDPRSEYTYGEFPFVSFDLLVDRAMDFLPQKNGDRCRTMVDLGSGCGRLVFYAALTRGETDDWDVHGVEIGTQLHSLAVNSLQRGVEKGWFESTTNSDEESRIAFHNGNALLTEDPYYTQSPSSDATHASIRSLLSQTDLLFAYSTVWETNASRPFDPELGAMVLSPKWSKALSELCPEGCVAVTTDRALDPEDGWRLVDRMDVENPSVWGSTGFVSVLERR